MIKNDILYWANSYRITKDTDYENNAYCFKHLCEKDIGRYVSQDEIADAFRMLGHKVKKIYDSKYVGEYCYRIYK